MWNVLVVLAWLSLVLVHVTPAVALFVPSTVQRLYGVAPAGDSGVLLVHRGALFLAVVAVCVMAAFQPVARRAASVVVAISLLGFLAVYLRAGRPEGLRLIALVDVVALAPLGLAWYDAWRG